VRNGGDESSRAVGGTLQFVMGCAWWKVKWNGLEEGIKVSSSALLYARNPPKNVVLRKRLGVDNYLAAVHNDLFINSRLSVSPLEPLVCLYSRFIHIDIEES
jgi:hypothetical protein